MADLHSRMFFSCQKLARPHQWGILVSEEGEVPINSINPKKKQSFEVGELEDYVADLEAPGLPRSSRAHLHLSPSLSLSPSLCLPLSLCLSLCLSCRVRFFFVSYEGRREGRGSSILCPFLCSSFLGGPGAAAGGLRGRGRAGARGPGVQRLKEEERREKKELKVAATVSSTRHLAQFHTRTDRQSPPLACGP